MDAPRARGGEVDGIGADAEAGDDLQCGQVTAQA
jgi:hypothetical protein